MKIGIVGAEAKKFTPITQAQARYIIRKLISDADLVVSGESPLGGVDWYAREEAAAMGIPFLPCPPATNRWHDGYKLRNLKIARESDMVVCIALAEYPASYTDRRFPACYHHDPPRTDHCKRRRMLDGAAGTANGQTRRAYHHPMSVLTQVAQVF